MGRFKKVKKRNPNRWPLILVLLLSVLASRTLLFQDGYFNMHDDLQMMRQLMLERCLLDGQIPCRWIPDMGYGFGFPLFNFYPPLPYIVGQLFRFIGFTFVNTAKYAFAAAIIASGATMYFFSKEFLGRVGGTLAAIFYVWAPYHSVDVYVRGAMNEAWALVWFPLILLFSYRIIAGNKEDLKRNVIFLSLSYAALLLTHNLMVLMFTPVLGLWIILHVVKNSDWKKIIPLFVSGMWAIGMAAFFTLPAVAENKFTQLESQLQGYYSFDAHFVSLRQLLVSRFWGFGASVWLEEDKMSFQIGHLHWILSLLVGLVLLLQIVKMAKSGKSEFWAKLKNNNILMITTFMLIIGWFGAFMTHSRSIFIWKLIPQLRLVQFPWRFLTIAIFGLSFVVGAIPGLMSQWKSKHGNFVKFLVTSKELFVLGFLTIFVVALNWNYFLPENGKMGPLTDEQKFTGAAWDLQQTAGIYDYLPSTAVMAPRAPMHELGEFVEGEGTLVSQDQGTDWGEFVIDVSSEEGAIVRIGIFEFPGWKVFVNGNEADHYVAEDEEWGRMYVDLPQGISTVHAKFTDTPVRVAGNWISVVSWVGMVGVVVSAKKRDEN